MIMAHPLLKEPQMPHSPIAIAADYADAMLAGRRAKNGLFLVLLLMLLGQIAVFFVLRMQPGLFNAATGAPTVQPVTNQFNLVTLLAYLTASINFLGIVLVIVLSFVLLLLVKIMLVGRLIGVARVTSAYIWCVLLAVMLFPWQAFLINPTINAPASSIVAGQPTTEFKIPGVLYTWNEVTHPDLGAQFGRGDSAGTPARPTTFLILRWARFVGFPILAVILLLTIQIKSTRGLRLALGETEFDTGESSPLA